MIVERVTVEGPQPSEATWPFDLAPVRQLVADGLMFTRPVTFLVGENGSGKSTIVEALAEAYGTDVRGGHRDRRYATKLAKGPLAERLRLHLTPEGRAMSRRPRGYFLRAETAFGVFEFMSDHGVPGYGDDHLLRVSHGESFLQVFANQFSGAGLFLLDEPEAALSFSSCLSLVATLIDLVADGAQVVCATHSPVLASLPGAEIVELDDGGMRSVAWEELELVQRWRSYLDDPQRYLRHLLGD